MRYLPSSICMSTELTPGEKVAYEVIFSTRREASPVPLNEKTDAELSKLCGMPLRTFQSQLQSLKKKGYINITPNPHKHSRRIFVHQKNDPTYHEGTPSEEELKKQDEAYQQALKHSVNLYDIGLEALVEKLRESPLLDEVEDNSTQFALTLGQIYFLGHLLVRYPRKKIDCQIAAYPNDVNFTQLLDEIGDSEFLAESDNVSLKSIMNLRHEIVRGNYRQFLNQHEKDIGLTPFEKRKMIEEDKKQKQHLESVKAQKVESKPEEIIPHEDRTPHPAPPEVQEQIDKFLRVSKGLT